MWSQRRKAYRCQSLSLLSRRPRVVGADDYRPSLSSNSILSKSRSCGPALPFIRKVSESVDFTQSPPFLSHACTSLCRPFQQFHTRRTGARFDLDTTSTRTTGGAVSVQRTIPGDTWPATFSFALEIFRHTPCTGTSFACST